MTRTLILLTSLLLVTSCSHRSDTEVRRNLPGAWHFVSSSSGANGDRSIFTIASNGDFTNQVISSSGVHVVDLSGTFQVQDGYLIGTVTQTSQKHQQLPYVLRAKIYRADESEMVIGYDGTTNQFTLKKDTK